MKFLATIIAALALAAPAWATNPSQAASEFRGTPITVNCLNAQEWQDTLGPFGITYTAFVPYSDPSSIYVGPVVCPDLLDALDNPTATPAHAIALQTFLHEMMHTAGIKDEHKAEEMSYFLYRWYLSTYFGYTAVQTKEMYRWSWVRHLARGEQYTIPAKYAPKAL